MIWIEMEMPEKCEECELEDLIYADGGGDPVCAKKGVGYTSAVRETGRLPNCPLKPPACSNCWHYWFTMGQCMNRSGLHYGKIKRPDEFCDEWYQNGGNRGIVHETEQRNIKDR